VVSAEPESKKSTADVTECDWRNRAISNGAVYMDELGPLLGCLTRKLHAALLSNGHQNRHDSRRMRLRARV
jgi:hypothetical protein